MCCCEAFAAVQICRTTCSMWNIFPRCPEARATGQEQRVQAPRSNERSLRWSPQIFGWIWSDLLGFSQIAEEYHEIHEISETALIWDLPRRSEDHEAERKGDHGFLDFTDYPGRRDPNETGCQWPVAGRPPRLLEHGGENEPNYG